MWSETLSMELLNKSDEDEIELNLVKKSFFQSDTILGGFSFQLSMLKDGLNKEWCYIYPVVKKKRSGFSPRGSNDPIAELLITIEFDLTNVRSIKKKKFFLIFYQIFFFLIYFFISQFFFFMF